MKRLSLLLLLLVPLAAGCGSDRSSLQGSGDALKDASSSRIEWKLEGKGVPDWALLRSTGSIDYANARGEMVIKGKSDSAPEARALFIGHDSYLGVEVDGKAYWMKQSIDDAAGAHRFEPGAGGMSPDRLLKELVKSSKKVEKLGSEEIRGVTSTHYRARPRQEQARALGRRGRARLRRRLDRRAGAPTTHSNPVWRRERGGGCLRPVRFRRPGRRRGAACGRDRLREQVRQADGEGMRQGQGRQGPRECRIRCV